MNILTQAPSLPIWPWQNFYVLVGSAGGGLIGIQFVVIALISSTRTRVNTEPINAFGTPTVVHFGGVLVLAAVMCAPWPSLVAVAVAIGIWGIGGFVYAVIVFRRARHQTIYHTQWDDWLWYVISPCAVYAVLTVAALLLNVSTQKCLYVIGAMALGLLLIGIRNAWDTVTHIVATQHQPHQEGTS